MNEEIDFLIARYLSGEATKKELHRLDQWLSKSKENEKYFQETTLLYQYAGQKGPSPTVNTEIALAQFKNYIREKPKTESRFKLSYTWKAAAAIVVLLVAGYTLFFLVNQPSKTHRIVAVESLIECEIFENTNVALFSNSEIIYNSRSKQNIQLKGKATFLIESETSSGIIVHAGETYIKDIGTVFTVDATQSNNYIMVEVSEGEVWFYTRDNNGVTIKQNESALFDTKSKQFYRELYFHNTTLEEAIEVIKKRYGVDIHICTEALSDFFLNASFKVNDSVEYVLEIIAETLGMKWAKTKNVYVITAQ